MKEFDVKFFIKDDDGDDYDFTEWYLNSQNVLELFTELEAFPCRIYVKSESEHIFEPKEGDLVSNYLHGNKGRHCHGFLSAQSSLTTSATIITLERKNGTSYFVESKSQITIIMRDNKHFFTPNKEVH
jgi:hypothetical protein